MSIESRQKTLLKQHPNAGPALKKLGALMDRNAKNYGSTDTEPRGEVRWLLESGTYAAPKEGNNPFSLFQGPFRKRLTRLIMEGIASVRIAAIKDGLSNDELFELSEWWI